MRRRPWLAATLSLVPGLGHFYVGKNQKGWALLAMTAGAAAAGCFSEYRLVRLLAVFIYLLTSIPAMTETFQIAKTGRPPERSDGKPYVILMLLMTGMTALPLLWQSARFSRAEKTAGSVAVVVLAILFFGGLAWLGPGIEAWLRKY